MWFLLLLAVEVGYTAWPAHSAAIAERAVTASVHVGNSAELAVDRFNSCLGRGH